MSYEAKSFLDYVFPADAPFLCAWCHKPIVGMTTWTGLSGDGPRHEECRGRTSKISGHSADGSVILITGPSNATDQDQIEYWRAVAILNEERVTELRREARHAPPPLHTGSLARALFETDEDVIALVSRVSEPYLVITGHVAPRTTEFRLRENHRAVRASAMQRCWERGAAGHAPEAVWYKRANERAALVASKLRDDP